MPSTRRSTSVATTAAAAVTSRHHQHHDDDDDETTTTDDFTTPAKPSNVNMTVLPSHAPPATAPTTAAAAAPPAASTNEATAATAHKVTPVDPHKDADVAVVASPPLPILTSTAAATATTTSPAEEEEEVVDRIRATVTSSPLEQEQQHSQVEDDDAREDTATPLQGNTQNQQTTNKQVRFDAAESAIATAAAATASSSEQQQQDSLSQKRGLVSRRGRYVSPGQRSTPAAVVNQVDEKDNDNNKNEHVNKNDNKDKPIAEFKTFRSPPRNSSSSSSKQQQQREEQEVPSLCSAGSEEQSLKQSVASKQGDKSILGGGDDDDNDGGDDEDRNENKNTNKAPTPSISCDPSLNPHTSPLATMMEGMGTKTRATTTTTTTKKKTTAAATMAPTQSKQGGRLSPTHEKKVVLSPARENAPRDDATKLLSPGGAVFLSPKMSSANDRRHHHHDNFEEKKGDDITHHHHQQQHNNNQKTPPRGDRHRVATPTDFSTDFGKNNTLSSSFDTSNVLAWLQSPTANGLFSPGGYGSILNTPGGPRTPRTPTVSTSFFFSDVASLPRAGAETLTPPKGGTGGGGGGENSSSKQQRKQQQQGISNIICISPLASSKARNGATPTNLREIFASPPTTAEKNKVRSLPLLQDEATTPAKRRQQQQDRPRVPQRSSSKDPSLDAVHLAERDLMEDEDMSVLLQLAANTPRSNAATAAGVVFRSPTKDGANKKHGGENGGLPALQLPMIGGQEGGPPSARLAARKVKTEHDDFAPPQLGMRSSSSSGSKEIVVGAPRTSKKKENSTAGGSSKGETDNKSKVAKGASAGSTTASNPPFSMHPPFPPQRDMPYYPIPGGMPPGMPPGPGGSMRVVVGGPPPKGSPSRGGMGGSPPPPPPHYHDYPPPYAPPPGMYSQYGPPMGYPYQGHYPPPPPRHMPMYGAQQHPGGGQKKGGKGIKPKSPSKRPGASLLDPKGAKKLKRGPSSGTKKKKTATPPITDRVERQKAAANVHAVNAASGGKNDRAAALAAAILRGVTMRPSGKWQAQLYFAGKSRYIGVFDTREKAALAYEIAREKLKVGPHDASGRTTENLVNAARKAAFDGVNERLA